MGQQQLLLIVLSVIIVGIAVVVGIEMSNQPTIESQLADSDSAFYQDFAAIAKEAAAVHRKYGDFSKLTDDGWGMSLLAHPSNKGIFSNRNGVFEITRAGDDKTVEITGVAKNYLNPATHQPLSVTMIVYADGHHDEVVNSPAATDFRLRVPEPGIPGQAVPGGPSR